MGVILKRFFVIFLVLGLFNGTFSPVAAGKEPVVLQVPFPELEGFTMTDDRGQRSGLVVDYLNEIAKYTGWTYEYIDTTGDEMVNDFISGQYDLMGGTYYAESMEKYFGYPKYSCGNTKSVLLARRDDNSISGYELRDLNGKTIGVSQRATENVRRLKEFLSANEITCTIKEYPPEAFVSNQIDDDLKNRIIDLKLGNAMDDTGEFRSVAYIDAQPHYIVTHPENHELLDQLNWAMEKILSSNPNFPNELYDKYFSGTNVHMLLLTEEEKTYIKEKGTITVAVPNYFHPFYCFNSNDGDHNGIIPDLLNKISEQYDLTFSYVFVDSYVEMQQMVIEGKADMAGFVYNDTVGSAHDKLATSAPYATLNDLVVRNKSVGYKGDGQTCGLLEGRHLPSYVRAGEVKYYRTVYEVLEAVNTGEVDFACGLSARMEQVIQDNIFSNVVPVTLSETRLEVSFALSAPADPDLLTIMNKGINSLSAKTKVALLDHNLISKGKLTNVLQRLIESNPIASVSLIAIFSILIVVAVVIVATARVKSVKMQKAVSRAESESKAKSEFLSRMSHEIRTPMNAIVGISNLILMKEDVPENMKNNLEKLNASSQYLLGLINDILDMSRVDSGMLEIDNEDFSLEQVLDELNSLMQSQAQRKHVKLCCTTNLKHQNLVGDPIRLKQVLMNLLSNAIKFTPADGQVSLIVDEINTGEIEATYLFRVRDTGIGVAEEDQDRIFKSFEQAGTNRERSQGTGLGLPISSNIVHLMGGTLQLKSKLGEGSEFFFSIVLPFGEKTETEKPDVSSNLFKNARFLLAEDNLLNAEIATELFELQGAQIELAKDGLEAVALFKQSKPGYFDLILMDVQMPNMNGLEATKAIRSSGHPNAETIPIIALTANSFQEDRDMARAAGMNDFLAKPLDFDHIFSVLQKWLSENF